MRDKNRKICWILNIGLFLILLILAIGFHNYAYSVSDTNCKSIIRATQFNIGSEDYADCQRFYNYPELEFELPYWMLWGLGHFFLAAALNTVLISFDMWDKEEDKEEDEWWEYF